MNIKEIQQIEDHGLREIRSKYWHLKHKAFLDESSIPDQEIGNIFDSLAEKEELEISLYLKTQEYNDND